MSKLHTERCYQRSTTQDTRQTEGRHMERWKVRRKREEHKTLLVFPSLIPLYFYWLLIFYFNSVHLLWTNKESGFTFWHVHIIQLLVFCCDAVRFSSARSGPTQHARSYLVPYYSIRTVTIQLPMRVVHGIHHSSPTVAMISHLMWLTNTKARLVV
jgi:hypothetical protein